MLLLKFSDGLLHVLLQQGSAQYMQRVSPVLIQQAMDQPLHPDSIVLADV